MGVGLSEDTGWFEDPDGFEGPDKSERALTTFVAGVDRGFEGVAVVADAIDEEKCVWIHVFTCASRAVSSPSGPLGGSSR